VIYALLLCSWPRSRHLERFFALKRESGHFRALRAGVWRAWARTPLFGEIVQRHPAPRRAILKTALTRSHHGPKGRGPADAASLAEKEGLRRPARPGHVGSNAPFVGLFGTVLGVIRAFHDLGQTTAGPRS